MHVLPVVYGRQAIGVSDGNSNDAGTRFKFLHKTYLLNISQASSSFPKSTIERDSFVRMM
jgi:hypothetical protein